MILVFSDIHIHNSGRFGDRDARLSHHIKCLRLIFRAAKNKDVQGVVFCGDLFDKHGTVSAKVLNPVVKAFMDFDKLGIPFIAISGNHDMTGKSYFEEVPDSLLEILDATLANFHLIDGTFYDLPSYRINGIPYYSNKESFEKQLKRCEPHPHNINVLITHNTPENSNSMIEVDIDVNNPDLQDYDVIFNGHIHNRESIGNFHTVGNPMQLDITDAGQEKGFYLYDRELTFVSMNKHLPVIHVSEEPIDEELVIVKPPEIEVGTAEITFKDYNQLFKDYVEVADTGELDKDKLINTIQKFL